MIFPYLPSEKLANHMKGNRLLDQVGAIFGFFMTFFYIGFGLFIIYAEKLNFHFNKALRNIIGIALILYGFFRGFRSYTKIKEAFFTRTDGDDN
jgi:cytochrome c biogenesis protein CcdA